MSLAGAGAGWVELTWDGTWPDATTMQDMGTYHHSQGDLVRAEQGQRSSVVEYILGIARLPFESTMTIVHGFSYNVMLCSRSRRHVKLLSAR